MKSELISGNDVKNWLQSDEVLKLTAFIYLKEELLAQRYENCATLIYQVKNLGANQGEISVLLAEVFKKPSQKASYEAEQKGRF